MVQTFEGGRRQRVENTLASWPFYSFVQPCNELLAETITARRTIRCVLVVSKHTGWPLAPHTTKTVWTIRPYRGTLVDGHGILCPHENISRVRSQIAPQPKPVCWSLLFARRPTPNLFGIAFRFCNASLPGGAMLRLDHLAFPFVLASQSQLRGLSTRA